MTILNIRDLSVIRGTPLFSGLSFTLNSGDRLGLIAANGRGKSTLFAVLAGDITRARNLSIAHVPQDVPEDLLDLPVRTVLQRVRPDEDWRAEMLLAELEFPIDLADRPLRALSGGWQRFTLLARAAMVEPDVMLLDEPTNHLDLARIGQLETWLSGLPKTTALVIASHDRAFLDAVTTRTLFLRPEASPNFALPYSRARAALAETDAAKARQFDNDLRRAGELRKQAAKLKNIGINSGSDLLTVKTRQLQARADKIEAAARPAHAERSAGAIQLLSEQAQARAVVTLNDAAIIAPDGRLLFRTGQNWIRNADRVVLLGPNGAGKTQLVRAVLASFADHAGTVPSAIRATPSARLGYSDQALTQVSAQSTPLEAITQRFDLGDQAAHAALAGAGISMLWQRRKVAELSGGQRARLAMLVLRLRRPSMFLLDEPTNHLDIEGQEMLEDELLDQEAAALIVSHDRSFIRAVGTRFWVIKGRHLVEEDDPEAFFVSQGAR